MSNINEREFPTPVVLTLTTGIVLGPFGDAHELAEFVMGHPIWSHEFAIKELDEAIKEAVFAQHPKLRGASVDGVTKDNYQEYVDRFVKEFGPTLKIKGGDRERTESPLESAARIMPNAKIIPVIVDSTK